MKTGRRQPSAKPEKESSPETESAGLVIWDFQVKNYEKINFCHLSHSVYGILLQQLKQTNTLIYLNILELNLVNNQILLGACYISSPVVNRKTDEI